jgi:hypothetical protein
MYMGEYDFNKRVCRYGFTDRLSSSFAILQSPDQLDQKMSSIFPLRLMELLTGLPNDLLYFKGMGDIPVFLMKSR